VLKGRDAPYIPGHGLGWLKIKCAARDEFAIIGWTDPADSREGFGVAAAGLLRFPGEPSLCRPRLHRVTRAVLRDLRNRLDQLAVNTAPGAEMAAAAPTRSHWVIPELVAEDPSPNEHEIGGDAILSSSACVRTKRGPRSSLILRSALRSTGPPAIKRSRRYGPNIKRCARNEARSERRLDRFIGRRHRQVRGYRRGGVYRRG